MSAWQTECQRPYRVECTGSLPNSEVKRRRARLVLGWGTAREHLRVLSAFMNLKNKPDWYVCQCQFEYSLTNQNQDSDPRDVRPVASNPHNFRAQRALDSYRSYHCFGRRPSPCQLSRSRMFPFEFRIDQKNLAMALSRLRVSSFRMSLGRSPHKNCKNDLDDQT